MTKYYRVRSQQEWDWLMNKFEKQGIKWQNGEAPTWLFENYDFVFGEKGAVVSFDGDCLRMGGHGNKLIEVSDLMEDEKMKDYVTIKKDKFISVNFIESDCVLGDHNKIGDIEELRIPKPLLYPKIQFTEAEKKEFDSINNDETLSNALDIIELGDYPNLYGRIYYHTVPEYQKFELEFARAWADPSLIEVIPEKKWNVRVPISNDEEFYKKDSTGKVGTVSFVEEHSLKLSDMQFTAEELKHYGLDNDLFEKVEVSE